MENQWLPSSDQDSAGDQVSCQREHPANTSLVRALMHDHYAVVDRFVMMIGNCVMAVIMLSQFWPGQLPGFEPRVLPDVDIASFEDLWFSANEVIFSCTSTGRGVGWHEEGNENRASDSCSWLILKQGLNLASVLSYGRETR